jgi:YEATS domain-containing protein 4
LVENPKKVGGIENKYAWTAYFKMADKKDNIKKYVRKVRFILDESFPLPEVTMTKPPFEHSNKGWGPFSIGIVVFFNPATGKKDNLVVEHMLNVKKGGGKKQIRVVFDKTKI